MAGTLNTYMYLLVLALALVLPLVVHVRRRGYEKKATFRWGHGAIEIEVPSTEECATMQGEVQPGEGVEGPNVTKKVGEVSWENFYTKHYDVGVPLLLKEFAANWRAVRMKLSSEDLRRIIENGDSVWKSENCTLEGTFPDMEGSYRAFDRGASTMSASCGKSAWTSLDRAFDNLLSCEVPSWLATKPFQGHCEHPDMIWHGFRRKEAGDQRSRDRHQDYMTCDTYYQVQISGVKEWRIQSPFHENQTGREPSIYKFISSPGDLVWFPPQMFHETRILTDSSVALNYQRWMPADRKEGVFFREFARKTLCSETLKKLYEPCLVF